MPFQSGLVYPTTSEGVSIRDVQRALADGSIDLYTLFHSSKVNIWSRYKPMNNPAIDLSEAWFDFTTMKWKTTATWWQGTEAASLRTCGIDIKTFSSPAALKSAVDGGNWGWTQKSLGTSPSRLTDFAWYNAQAPSPFNDFSVYPHEQVGGGDIGVSLGAIMVGGSYTLGLQDIPMLPARYLGVLIFRGSTFFAAYIDSAPLSQKDVPRAEFSFAAPPLSTSTPVTYTVYPVLCSSNSTSGSNTYIPLPFEPQTFKVTNEPEQLPWMRVTAITNQAMTQLKVKFTFNHGKEFHPSSATVFQSVVGNLFLADSGTTGIYNWSLGNISIPVGSDSVSRTGTSAPYFFENTVNDVAISDIINRGGYIELTSRSAAVSIVASQTITRTPMEDIRDVDI